MLKILLICLIVSTTLSVITVDLTQKNKYGNATIYNTPCNKDSQIDFFFSSESRIFCPTGICTSSELSASTMKFMDIQGNDLVLILASAEQVEPG